MRTVSALEVRRRFGQLVDEAAAGERLIIERAGQPIAALVPLSDLPEAERDARLARRMAALQEIRRFPVRLRPGLDAARTIREQRRQRTAQIMQASPAGPDEPKPEPEPAG
jgi:prevent-host-death family protein